MNGLKGLLAGIVLFFVQQLQAQQTPKYEFRAVWVATVENIDWPSKKNLSTADQKAEFIRLLDMHKRNGMNAVIVQVRPAADAFYPSKFEPWSEYLNGHQGLAPVPYYDPLQFMIEETHKRGMEFHAWLNPYRAVFNIRSSSISPLHITHIHPEWFLTYGDKKYFDPGRPQVVDYVTNVVKDIAERYDIDAIHMDDYFYPYKIPGKEFPDYKSYLLYGNHQSKADWRRSNCDSIIKHIHDAILEVNPMIKFGISPFGVWRNKSDDINGSDTKAGTSNYDGLYADILLWLKKGWIDYVAPQLYWEIGNRLCDFETLANWWAAHSYGRHVYIGHGIYRVFERASRAWQNTYEIPEQIAMLRETPNIQGSIFYSSKIFAQNPHGWNDSLRLNYYRTPALIPPMLWIDTTPPLKPFISYNITNNGTIKINGIADTTGTETIKNYVLYITGDSAAIGAQPVFVTAADDTNSFAFDVFPQQIPAAWQNCYIAATCIDKQNNESPLSNVLHYIKTNGNWLIKQE